MRKKGFTLIELLVVIAIIAILAAILFPVFVGVKNKARRTECLSNLSQCAKAIIVYSHDWDGCTPFAWNENEGMGVWWRGTWREKVQTYLSSTDVLHCPLPTFKKHQQTGGYDVGHYGMNVYVFAYGQFWGWAVLNDVPKPSETILVAENWDGDFSAEPLHNDSTGVDGQFYPYHSSKKVQGGNFVICDAHAIFLSVKETEKNNFYWWRMAK